MHFSHLPQQYKYSSVKHSYLNLFSMVLKLSGTSHLPYFAKLKHILASPIRISTTCTWIMPPFIGTVSDTNFPRGPTAHPTGARWEMFTAFRILVCIREKKRSAFIFSYFLVQSYPLCCRNTVTSQALPVWRTPLAETWSSDDGDPRLWLDDWYLLYATTVIRLSACQFWKPKGSNRLIVSFCSGEWQKSHLSREMRSSESLARILTKWFLCS